MNELTWTNWNEWIERNELPKVLRTPQFFLRFFLRNRAFAEVSCAFCRHHLKRSQPSIVSRLYVINYLMTKWSTYQIELLLQSRAHFVDLISKSGPRAFSFLRCLCETELSLQSRANFVYHFPGSRRAPGNRDPLAATPDGHFTRKNAWFCARECFQAWIHVFPTTWWWCGWHDDWDDDVVAMMVRQLAIDKRP